VEILRTVPGKVAGRSTAAPAGRRVTGEFDPSLPYAGTVEPGLRAGTPLRPLDKQITQEQASVFSRAGEYVRNIHSDLDIAREAGLSLPIVQGQQQCCLVLELLTRFFGAAWFTDGWIRCKFTQPVRVFERLTVGAVITDLAPVGDGRSRVSLDVWVRREDGRLSTVGWASCAAADPADRRIR
jgi:acyl dehydratase